MLKAIKHWFVDKLTDPEQKGWSTLEEIPNLKDLIKIFNQVHYTTNFPLFEILEFGEYDKYGISSRWSDDKIGREFYGKYWDAIKDEFPIWEIPHPLSRHTKYFHHPRKLKPTDQDLSNKWKQFIIKFK